MTRRSLRDAWRELAGGADGPPPAERDPHAVQWCWLRDCLRRNAGCAYGARHGFARIDTVEAFRAAVPLSDYGDYTPWIERMAQGEADLLFAGRPVAFERTSGNGAGAGKLVPYSDASLADFSRALLPWLGGVARRYAFSGTAYWAISPAARAPECTPGGTPVGLHDAAYLGEPLVDAFVSVSAVGPEAAALTDVDTWQRQTWLELLRHADLELISVWSPTFVLALLDALPRHADVLAAQLDQGASRRLREFLSSGDSRVLWPRLRLVSCWRDGASRTFFEALQRCLPQAQFQPKGLLMTEGVVTVPDAQDAPVLAGHSGFFEFIDAGGACRLAHELTPGESYEAVMTTAAGLYRYRTGDRVRCGAYREGWPVLDFLGRGGLCCDLVGEKLDDAFVADCLPQDGGFHLLIPLIGSAQGDVGYALIVDADDVADTRSLAQQVEQRLQRNPQYVYARRLGQLRPLRVLPARRPLRAYLNRMVRKGMRLGDIKLVALRPENDWLDTFEVIET